MKILGIESSCDETSAAVVDDGRLVQSNIVASQIPVHERFGGVVPEIASRQHVLAIDSVTHSALDNAGCTLDDIDAVAVTYGPGLSGPLMVGTTFAKGLSLSRDLPMLSVNHIEGHVLSVWLSHSKHIFREPRLPMISLVVSGGHTELHLVKRPGEYRRLGQTRDDAVGEAFDKVGRLLGLPYPGGPSIELAAAEADTSPRVSLPRPWLPGTLDFSFSGLKTAVMREVKQRLQDGRLELESDEAKSLASEFQDAVTDILCRKLCDAVTETQASSAAIVGGVASNLFIRSHLAEALDVPLYVPGAGLSADNAAMIAGAAFWSPRRASMDLEIQPSVRM